MIQAYLLQYGIFFALFLLSVSSIFMFRAQFKVPSILIGVSSSVMFVLKLMHEISFSQELVSNVYNEQGQILGANVELTMWQSLSLWIDPIGLIVIALGCLVLSRKLFALNKERQNHPAGWTR